MQAVVKLTQNSTALNNYAATGMHAWLALHTYSSLPFILLQGVLVLVVICAGVSTSLLSVLYFRNNSEAEALRYWGNAAAIYTVVVSIIGLISGGSILITRFFLNNIIFHIVVSMHTPYLRQL